MSFTNYLSRRSQYAFNTIFSYLARKIDAKPWSFILIGILLTLVCGSGLLMMKEADVNVIQLWGNRQSKPYKQFQESATLFGDSIPSTLLISTQNEDDSILTPHNLHLSYNIFNKINDIQLNNKDNTSYYDLCQKYDEYNECASDYSNIFYLFKVLGYNISALNTLTNEQIKDVINNQLFINSMNLFLGNIQYDNDNKIIGASTLRLIYSLNDNPNLYEFEGLFQDYWSLHHNDDEYNHLHINYLTGRSTGDEMAATLEKDYKLFVLAFIIIITYLLIITTKLNCYGIRIYLVYSVIFVLICSLIMGFGLASYFGVEYHSTILLISFVLLGVGVDDMIILVDSYNHTNNITNTLTECGLSISLTSLSSTVAFFLGAIVDIKGIQTFCLYSALSFFSMYILQFFMFVPVMVLDHRRIIAKRNFCCPCLCTHNNEADDNMDDEKSDEHELHNKHSISDTLITYFISLLFEKRYRRWIIIIVWIIFLVLSIVAFPHINTATDVSTLLPDDSYVLDYLDTYNDDFDQQYISELTIIIKDADFSDINTLANTLNLIQELNIDNSSIGSVENWLQNFLEYNWEHNIYYSNDSYDENLDFYANLQEYISVNGSGTKWEKDIIFDDMNNATYIKASKFTLNVFTPNNDENNFVYYMYPKYESYNKIFSKYMTDGYIITRDFVASYTMYHILDTTIKNCLITTFSVFILLSFLLDLKISGFILIIIMSINFYLGAWMYILDIALDSLSYFLLVISVGLTCDYVIHITHSICHHIGNIKIAFNEVGISVIKGAFSTFLGVLCLAFSQSQGFRIFFKMFVGIIIIALIHGIIFTPALLMELPFIYNTNSHYDEDDDVDDIQLPSSKKL